MHDARQAHGHAASLIRTIPRRGCVFEEVAHATSCDPIPESRISRNGLPSDPLMQITRAIALVRFGRQDEAAICARDAARQPNAYSTALALAALILATAGPTAEAGRVVAKFCTVAPHFRPVN